MGFFRFYELSFVFIRFVREDMLERSLGLGV